jgi:hypothetical protein
MRFPAGLDVGPTTDFALPADEERLLSPARLATPGDPARTRIGRPAPPDTEANESVTRRASGAT